MRPPTFLSLMAGPESLARSGRGIIPTVAGHLVPPLYHSTALSSPSPPSLSTAQLARLPPPPSVGLSPPWPRRDQLSGALNHRGTRRGLNCVQMINSSLEQMLLSVRLFAVFVARRGYSELWFIGDYYTNKTMQIINSSLEQSIYSSFAGVLSGATEQRVLQVSDLLGPTAVITIQPVPWTEFKFLGNKMSQHFFLFFWKNKTELINNDI